ncbi:hypothetical protein ACFQY0_18595 [Haloferula chungangensis]|uniref:Uncharacterized protein n=1 Tax=Haloferula chungangensis TaxID=1048331 RepID=A0ABW2LDK2_9BACT
MKMKVFGTALLALIVVLVWLIASQRLPSKVSGDQYINLNVDGVQCIVAAFEIQPIWTFSSHVKKDPEKTDRWKSLVLVSQSDILKFFDNREASGMYGRVAITDQMIEEQRSYVIDRFGDQSHDLGVSKVFIVLDPSAQTAHLLVPIKGPQGDYFTSLEWINGDWYLVPGMGETAWAVLNAKKILKTSESQDIKKLPSEQIEPVMRKLSAAYLKR